MCLPVCQDRRCSQFLVTLNAYSMPIQGHSWSEWENRMNASMTHIDNVYIYKAASWPTLGCYLCIKTLTLKCIALHTFSMANVLLAV